MALTYCTNVHPAESWAETFHVVKNDVIAVRNRLRESRDGGKALSSPLFDPFPGGRYAIGLRLSARAARELRQGSELEAFRHWLETEGCVVLTINGFPYGDFHGTRVKEQVFAPDWTAPARLAYTQDLAEILTELADPQLGGSLSTLPGSFKEFAADNADLFGPLAQVAQQLEDLSERRGVDLHLGLEPEPLGHFENTRQTLHFFEEFGEWAQKLGMDEGLLQRRLGLNYDTCHFALQFEDAQPSLEALQDAGLRLSKIHLSNALHFDPRDPVALEQLERFVEPTYLHQVLLRSADQRHALVRFRDLPDFLAAAQETAPEDIPWSEGRCHFHIPLDASPEPPLFSTAAQTAETLALLRSGAVSCPHLEIETYTWEVLPQRLQRDLTQQIVAEYDWVLAAVREGRS